MPSLGQGGIVDGLPHRPGPELAGFEQPHALARYVDILLYDVAPVSVAIVQKGRDCGRPDTHVRIEHGVTGVRHRHHQAFHELDGKLARMNRFFGMIALDVRKDPNVTRVFPQRIPGNLSGLRALVVTLTRVFGRDADWIQVPSVVVAFRPPADGLVSSRQPSRAVQPMAKVPDDPVSELESLSMLAAVAMPLPMAVPS